MTQKTQLAHDVSAAAVFTLPPSSNAYLADVGSGLQTVYDPPDDLTLTMTRSLVQTDSPREVRPFEPLLCMSCVCVYIMRFLTSEAGPCDRRRLSRLRAAAECGLAACRADLRVSCTAVRAAGPQSARRRLDARDLGALPSRGVHRLVRRRRGRGMRRGVRALGRW